MFKLDGKFEECLQMFFKIPAVREEVFNWISDVRKTNMGGKNFTHLKNHIVKNMSTFIEMDAINSIKLTEKWLDGDHLTVVETLTDSEIVFKYLVELLKEKE